VNAIDPKTILIDELQNCIRVLRNYERRLRDIGHHGEAAAVAGRADRACAASLYAKGVRRRSNGSFGRGGLFDLQCHDITEGTKQALLELIEKEG